MSSSVLVYGYSPASYLKVVNTMTDQNLSRIEEVAVGLVLFVCCIISYCCLSYQCMWASPAHVHYQYQVSIQQAPTVSNIDMYIVARHPGDHSMQLITTYNTNNIRDAGMNNTTCIH